MDLVADLFVQTLPPLTNLDRAVAQSALARPKVWDPLLKILAERGTAHEQSYIDHLSEAGFEVVRIDGVEVTDEATAATLAALRKGVQVIVQGALAHDGWIGRADILHRVDGAPSALGDWSYEVIDTKLARGLVPAVLGHSVNRGGIL